jgi:hypothetical protein
MAHPVVIRTAKLTTPGSIRASGAHTWRERDTPNADPDRTANNSDWRPVHSADALADAVAARVALATEKAADPVLCIEYLVTAKAEAFKEQGGKVDADAYFRDALAWLEKRHGAENVVAVNIQRDEKAPHMVAYAVPLVETEGKTRRRSVIVGTNPDGTKRRETREFQQEPGVRLSAAHYQGSRGKLRALQTEFAAEVGARHGLVRGIENSQAKHQTVREWYGRLDLVANDPRLKPAKLVPVPDAPGPMTWGEKRREAQQAREAALANNQKAREHNAERGKLMQALAGRGFAHVSEQARAAQAVEKADRLQEVTKDKMAQAAQLSQQLVSAKTTLKQHERQQADLQAKLTQAEQRSEKLLKGAQQLVRELAQHAPERARELRLVVEKEAPQRGRSGPGMSR